MKSREVYSLGRIFALDASLTAEESLKKFADTIAEDGYLPPEKGESLPVRDGGTSTGTQTDWFDVTVT